MFHPRQCVFVKGETGAGIIYDYHHFKDRKDDRSKDLVEKYGERSDLLAVMKELIGIRNGQGTVDDIDHLGNRRIRCIGEMAE